MHTENNDLTNHYVAPKHAVFILLFDQHRDTRAKPNPTSTYAHEGSVPLRASHISYSLFETSVRICPKRLPVRNAQTLLLSIHDGKQHMSRPHFRRQTQFLGPSYIHGPDVRQSSNNGESTHFSALIPKKPACTVSRFLLKA